MAKFKKKAKKPDIDVTALTKAKETSAGSNSKKSGKKKNKLKEEKRKTKKLKGAAKDQIKVKKVKKSVVEDVEEEEDVLTLDILKELGGDEEDLKLVQAIGGNDVAADDLNAETENELKSLLKSLNFKKFKSKDFIVKDDEVAAEEEEEKAEEVPKKAKEKERNKVQDAQISSTTAPDPKEEVKEEDEDDAAPLLPDSVTQRADFHFVKEPAVRTHHVLKAAEGAKWFEVVSNAAATPEEALRNKYWAPKLEKYTKAAWELDTQNYKKASMRGPKKSEAQWLETVLKSGTMGDKLSAYTVLLQEAPVHNLAALDTLISLVSLKSRRPCLLAIDSLKELFITSLLPPDRKLRGFESQPFHELGRLSGGNKDTRDRYLITWLWEDRLRRAYAQFLEALEAVGRDTVDRTKTKAIATVAELLAGCPEQEGALLERLVNKLGDPTRAVAAKAMYHLSQLLEQHSAMRQVVIGEVERLLYRQNISPKAQYYGVCFLSTILMDRAGSDALAAKLITIYFSFFKVSVQKGEVDTKLMTALLTGVNRAFPYAKLAPAELDSQLETMHKLVHMVGFNTSIQALTLLYQVMDQREAVTDRFYTALYRKILDPALAASSRQVMFLNLLYKALKADPSVERVKAFVKRLLQVCEYQPSQLICGLLFLLSELLRARPELGSARQLLHPEGGRADTKFEDDDDEEEHYEDVKEEDGEEAEGSKPKKVVAGWTFTGGQTKSHDPKDSYDPTCRNPLYCGAERSALWELERLAGHFHPSAALFATNLLDNQPIKYSGDPLGDFTLARFLDRFVFRNPKKNPEKNKPTTVLGKRNIYRPSGIKAVAPDSKDFRKRDEGQVPTDELYLYKYFNEKVERKGEKEKEEDNVSVTSDEFNQYLDKMAGGRQADFDDEDMDFAGGLEEEGAKKRKAGDEDDGDDSDEADEAGSDEEPTLEGEEEDGFKELDSDGGGDELEDGDDFDEEGFGGDSDDDLDEEGFGEEGEDDAMDTSSSPKLKPAKGKRVKTKFPKFDPNNLESLFADADQFAHLMEENDDTGTGESVSNKDRAGKKQLAWEASQGGGQGGGRRGEKPFRKAGGGARAQFKVKPLPGKKRKK